MAKADYIEVMDKSPAQDKKVKLAEKTIALCAVLMFFIFCIWTTSQKVRRDHRDKKKCTILS